MPGFPAVASPAFTRDFQMIRVSFIQEYVHPVDAVTDVLYPRGVTIDVPEGVARSAIEAGAAIVAEMVAVPDAPDMASAPSAPPAGFLDRNAADIVADLDGLGVDELDALREAEAAGKARKGVLSAIDARLADAAAFPVEASAE